MAKEQMVAIIIFSFFCTGSTVAFSQTTQGAEGKSDVVTVSQASPNQAGDKANKNTTQPQTATSCSCTSGDGKKNCSVSCKEGQKAYCDCDEKTATCTCN